MFVCLAFLVLLEITTQRGPHLILFSPFCSVRFQNKFGRKKV